MSKGKYHIAQSGKKKGLPVLCHANIRCTLVNDSGNNFVPHFDNLEEAESYAKEMNKKKGGILAKLSDLSTGCKDETYEEKMLKPENNTSESETYKLSKMTDNEIMNLHPSIKKQYEDSAKKEIEINIEGSPRYIRAKDVFDRSTKISRV